MQQYDSNKDCDGDSCEDSGNEINKMNSKDSHRNSCSRDKDDNREDCHEDRRYYNKSSTSANNNNHDKFCSDTS